ncbi:glycosyltransferase family 2 protein [Roseovarius tibetensis]|uniref:glycosyltransferase family 2 protein n=1 Tax=Roseovarius tibetensis TaxID=2685897 RepID=UPI003D7F9025
MTNKRNLVGNAFFKLITRRPRSGVIELLRLARLSLIAPFFHPALAEAPVPVQEGSDQICEFTLKISVVTAVFNNAATVGQAIESVLSQHHDDIELLVQDGVSTDGTLEVLRGIEDPRLHLVSEADDGIYNALNRAIARATGDVVGLMHSDDFYATPDVLSKVAAALEDPEIDGVYGDLTYVSAQDPERVIRYWRAGAYTPAKLRRGWMPPHPTLFLGREVFEHYGLYDTSFRIAADYDAMLRYLVKGQIRLAYIPEVLVNMRMGGESNRSLERLVRKSREDYRAIRENGVGGMGTLMNKNFSKLSQFWKRA